MTRRGRRDSALRANNIALAGTLISHDRAGVCDCCVRRGSSTLHENLLAATACPLRCGSQVQRHSMLLASDTICAAIGCLGAPRMTRATHTRCMQIQAKDCPLRQYPDVSLSRRMSVVPLGSIFLSSQPSCTAPLYDWINAAFHRAQAAICRDISHTVKVGCRHVGACAHAFPAQ
eukprot:6209608-Pleurochrysis_carterae.AAC.1